MLGLMNNIIINNNNNIIICFSLYLIAVLGIEPTYYTCHAVLPLDYTTNYDYLILLFLTISSWYLIRYYIVIGYEGIEPTLYLRHNPLIPTTKLLVPLGL